MARRISVEIVGNAAQLERTFGRAGASARGFNSSIGSLRIGIGSLIKSVVVIDAVQAAFRGLDATVHAGIHEFSEHAQVAAQTTAALKSTGAVANVSGRQIESLALQLSNLSGVDDEVIQKGENLLLSFTNIRNFAGKNNDIFTQATKVMLDFSIRTGKDAAQSAIILGRALADPASRVSSLSRAGVVFTKQQIAQLKAVEKTKGVLAAQKLLLVELRKRYEGAAAAAGKTLPGQLNVLRDRFKDLGGELVGTFAPAVTKGVAGLTNLVRGLSEAKGLSAKIGVVVDLGRSAIEGIRRRIAAIDWGKVKARFVVTATAVGDVGKQLLRSVLAKIEAINWSQVGQFIGQQFKRIDFSAVGRALSNGLARALNSIDRAVRNVNWQAVGRALVVGAGALVVAVARFLAGINWRAVFGAALRLAADAALITGKILLGVGKELGSLLVQGVSAGLSSAAAFLEKKAVTIVLAIIEPFSHLPRFLGGGPFQDMKASLQKTLADMQTIGATGGTDFGTAITSSAAAAISTGMKAVNSEAVNGARNVAVSAGQRFKTQAPAQPAGLPAPPSVPARTPKGLTASQRNTFFDNAIARILLRGGLGTIQQQIAALTRANALLEARLKATKDVTRRLNLEDQILQNAAQVKSLRTQQAADALQKRQDTVTAIIANLQLRLTKAQATASFSDDLAALKALQAGIKAEIREFGKTADLQGQLFDVQQQIKAAKVAQITARQFRQLGLTATGEDITPGVAGLKKRLAQLTANVKLSTLDTPKLESELARFRKVLSEGLVPKDVREKIQQMIDDIAAKLKDAPRQLTKFAHVNSNAVLAGLGLTPEQTRALRARIAQIGAGGTVPGTRSAAFAGAGAGPPIVVNSNIHLDGELVARNTTKHQRKDSQRRTDSRRGPYAGRN